MVSKLFNQIRLTGLLMLGFSTLGVAQQSGVDMQEKPVGVATPVQGRGPVIAIRDLLTVKTLNEPTFSGQFVVNADGTFDFPYLGRIPAAGLTVRDVETDLKKRLSPEWIVNPQVTIELQQTASKRVLVGGEVRQTGIFPFSGAMTVREALIRAGGLAETAGDRAYVLRAARDGSLVSAEEASQAVKEYVNLHELLDLASVKENLTLQDGDTVMVEKAVPVSVSGYVRTPGQYAIRPGTTVQQVVTMAGGLSELGKANGIKIERPTSDPKKPQTITVTDKTWKTEIVKPGDNVIVPRRIM